MSTHCIRILHMPLRETQHKEPADQAMTVRWYSTDERLSIQGQNKSTREPAFAVLPFMRIRSRI